MANKLDNTGLTLGSTTLTEIDINSFKALSRSANLPIGTHIIVDGIESVIFYKSPSLTLVADTHNMGYYTSNNENEYFTWSNAYNEIGTSEAIGTGKSNTDKIISSSLQDGDLWTNLKTVRQQRNSNEWFVPSIDELIELNNQKQYLTNWVEYYWSSSEYSDYPTDGAWYFDVRDGEAYGNGKNGTYLGRLVRAI